MRDFMASRSAGAATARRVGAADARGGATWAPLPPALDAQRHHISHDGRQIAMYLSMPRCHERNVDLHPLLLVHSVNAAGSAAEVKPVFDRYAAERPVVALELPGFGTSDRPNVEYTPRLMSGAVCCAIEYLADLGFRQPVDLMAVSLSCEIAARAALARPAAFRSLALVSPTGFESRRPERYAGGRTKRKPWLRWLLESGPWSDPLFRALTREKSMRAFLKRAWGREQIDEGLLAYNLLTVKQPGARHAPYAFIAGCLFTRGVSHLYAQLPQPVWMIHGTRGEFAKVDGLQHFAAQPRWTIESIDTGAMPYFERPAEFAAGYDRFVAALAQPRS